MVKVLTYCIDCVIHQICNTIKHQLASVFGFMISDTDGINGEKGRTNVAGCEYSSTLINPCGRCCKSSTTTNANWISKVIQTKRATYCWRTIAQSSLVGYDFSRTYYFWPLHHQSWLSAQMQQLCTLLAEWCHWELETTCVFVVLHQGCVWIWSGFCQMCKD